MLAILIIAFKAALIALVVGGIIALVVRGVRRSRANRLDPRWNDHRTQPGYWASAHGVMPNTPLPEWAYSDDESEDETPCGNVRVTPLH